ncbi:MAG: hypothetical protein MZV70_43710 [Desulfobacterales bacterium]|nr:hypothetical protein [Desulfobacterales bacterium]
MWVDGMGKTVNSMYTDHQEHPYLQQHEGVQGRQAQASTRYGPPPARDKAARDRSSSPPPECWTAARFCTT